MKFSDRIGITKAKETIQINHIDDELKVGLWNGFQIYYLDKITFYYRYPNKDHRISQSNRYDFFRDLWIDFYKLTLDSLDDSFESTNLEIKRRFFEGEWFEIYNFLEYVLGFGSSAIRKDFMKYINKVLEKELSGYRFINGVLAPITNSYEVEEIDSSINNAINHNLIGVFTHLDSALKKIADKQSPDYRNSIKESISAVESISKVISNNPKDSLGGALDKIKGKINLHSSLEKGFKQIYGYTSDADGIRHGLSEQSNCDFEDAKYMLVSSSAFVNYLIAKALKAGIEL
jgi:hypothetical protein